MSGFTFVEAQSANAAYPPPSVPFTEAVAVGDVLIAWVWLNGVSSDAGISVSDNVNSGGWTQFANIVDATNTTQMAFFYKVANAAGTPTVTPALVTDYYGYTEIAHFTVPTGASLHADSQVSFTGSSASANTSGLASVHDDTLMTLMVRAASAYIPGYSWSGGSGWNGTAQSASQPPLYANVATAGTNNDVDVGLSASSTWVALAGLLYYTTSNPISGSASITVSATGALSATGLLSGAAAIAAGASGTVTGRGALGGAAAAQFGAAATLFGIGNLTGAVGAQFGAAGTLLGSGALLGTVTVSFGATGTCTAPASIGGAAAIEFAAIGTLHAASSGNLLTGFYGDEDIEFLLSEDFGCAISIAGGAVIPGIIDYVGKDVLVSNGVNGVSATDIVITVQTTALPANLKNRTLLMADGKPMRLRDSQQQGDGALTHLICERVL